MKAVLQVAAAAVVEGLTKAAATSIVIVAEGNGGWPRLASSWGLVGEEQAPAAAEAVRLVCGCLLSDGKGMVRWKVFIERARRGRKAVWQFGSVFCFFLRFFLYLP